MLSGELKIDIPGRISAVDEKPVTVVDPALSESPGSSAVNGAQISISAVYCPILV
jgi:hypothetical protein